MAEPSRPGEIDSIRAAFGFLTRFPLPQTSLRPGSFGGAVQYFPLVGLALGALAGLSAVLLSRWLPPWPVAIGVVALIALLTGGLHLDGLADSADGLGGGRGDRDRTLSIMRDSRLGSFGAIALVIVLLGKISALVALIGMLETGDAGPGHVFWGLVLMSAAGRWSAVLLIRCFPYARVEGLGRKFRDESGSRELLGATVTLAVALLVAGQGGWGASLAAVFAALLVGAWVNSRIGGLTGDVYGAGIELAELVFLWMYIS